MRLSHPWRRRPACALPALLLLSILALPVAAPAAPAAAEPAYPDASALDRALERLAKQEGRVRLQELARTPGDRAVHLVTVLPAAGKAEGAPAVLVLADPDGTTPLATRAALDLCRLLVRPAAPAPAETPGEAGGEAAGKAAEGAPAVPPTWSAAELTWYVVPALDPDGAARFHAAPLCEDGRNGRAVDDDMDGLDAEDGPDDLDGDGVIATMLVRHPDGGWILTEDEPPLFRRAEAAKGEQGLYLREVEGHDDDGDGRRNEDGPGGVVPGHNFPHAFEPWAEGVGLWPTSEAESRAVLRVAFDHPEIALVLVLGRSNTLLKVPEADRKAEASGGKYKLPERMARRLGIDPEQEFSLDELVQMAREFTGQRDLTGDDVLGFLELGAAVNPNRRDLAWWNALAERYQELQKAAGRDGERLDPPASGSGSPQEWAYYQFGVPSFAVDFWSLPKPKEAGKAGKEAAAGEGVEGGAPAPEPLTPDRLQKMSKEEFLDLGDERIAAFLKENDAPSHLTPQMLRKALEGGMLTMSKLAAMMRERAGGKDEKETGKPDEELTALAAFARAHPEAHAWLPWHEVKLPDGREALVGGPAPFATHTPPPAMVDSLLAPQLPWLLELPGWLPRLEVSEIQCEPRGGDVWQVTAWIANRGRIPYPTFQGKRTRRPGPVVITLAGGEVLEGRPRATLDQVEGLGTASVRWLVRVPRGKELTVTAEAPAAGRAARTVTPTRQGGHR